MSAMKLLRFGPKGGERPGLLDGEGRIRDLSGVVADIDARTLPDLQRLRVPSIDSLPIVNADVRIGAPVAGVGKIICVGLNYSDHARETGQAIPREPILFLKATSSIVGPNDDVVLPPGAEKGDWEVELGIVIAREARYVPLASAMDYVAGACVVNDVSERSYQLERGGQWDKGKGCDTFCPLGPYLVTLDAVPRLDDLRMWCTVNGRTVQDGNTRTMIFDVPYLVHYISQFMSLQPGDVISTGTPPGVGMGMKPPQWLKEQDIMELGIEGLGTQRQRVVRHTAEARS
jgi:ureidoglycolate lyase/2,4-diketo-3-deoxy-L-fuconate hydrolase